MGQQDVIYDTIPVGSLGLIALKSSEELGNKVNNYLVSWRNNRDHEHASTIAFAGYIKDSYLIDTKCPVSARAKQRVLSTNPSEA